MSKVLFFTGQLSAGLQLPALHISDNRSAAATGNKAGASLTQRQQDYFHHKPGVVGTQHDLQAAVRLDHIGRGILAGHVGMDGDMRRNRRDCRNHLRFADLRHDQFIADDSGDAALIRRRLEQQQAVRPFPAEKGIVLDIDRRLQRDTEITFYPLDLQGKFALSHADLLVIMQGVKYQWMPGHGPDRPYRVELVDLLAVIAIAAAVLFNTGHDLPILRRQEIQLDALLFQAFQRRIASRAPAVFALFLLDRLDIDVALITGQHPDDAGFFHCRNFSCCRQSAAQRHQRLERAFPVVGPLSPATDADDPFVSKQLPGHAGLILVRRVEACPQ